jgi:hypothetical protein
MYMNTIEISVISITFLIIIIFLINRNAFIIYSNTILGKLIAIAVIIFYTAIDKIVGLFVCAIVIFYYQSDYVESMMNMSLSICHTK